MKTYAIRPGSKLVFSADGGFWESLTFRAKDFADPSAATASEVAAAIDRADHIESAVGADGNVEIATTASGSHASLEIDLGRSTAAGALGLTPRRAAARGTGPATARLVSQAAEPFEVPEGAELTLRRNGLRRKVVFKGGFKAGAATAHDVVAILNQRMRGAARVTRDGRVMLHGRGVGPGSAVEVEPAAAGTPDAAEALGFTGAAAMSQPLRTEPAKLALHSGGPQLYAVSLSSAPIELQLPSGTVTLAPRTRVPLSSIDAIDSQLRRLIAQGAIRLAGGIDD